MINREIKFRFWHILEKVMIQPSENLLISGNGHIWNGMGGTLVDTNYYKKPIFIPLQFTGLKDKNGKDIYDGDIFDCIYKFDGCEHKLMVIWNEESASFIIQNIGECDQPSVSKTMHDLERLEIIGNKFENPELLINRKY